MTSGGNSFSNQFLVLNHLDNGYISNVASELHLVIENVDTQLDTFRAKERVRAALAEANYIEHLAKINKKTAPQGEELMDLALNTTDNSSRGAQLESEHDTHKPPKGRGRHRKKQK